jgi:hypothetical protein
MGGSLVHHSKIDPAMSALGQKRTWDCRSLMSALPPKADIVQRSGNVRFVPIVAIRRLRKVFIG